jgi:hypothetical protein
VTLIRISYAALLAGFIALAPQAFAGVIVSATGAAAPNGALPTIAQSASASTSGGFAAFARVSGDDHGHFNTGFGSTYDDSTCIFLPCVWQVDGRATASGLLGVARASAGIGMNPFPGGGASGEATITDTITPDSASVAVTLDSLYQIFQAGRPGNPSPLYTGAAGLQFIFRLSDPDSVNVYTYALEFSDTVESDGTTTFQDRHYVRTEQVGDTDAQIDTFTNFPFLDGSFHHSAELALSAYIGVPLSLEFTVTASAQCEFAPVPGTMCTSIADTWDTSYLGLNGQFTSANGYSYPGLADTTAPEPAGYSFIGLALVLGGVWRRRR